jgi:hypothetical protein
MNMERNVRGLLGVVAFVITTTANAQGYFSFDEIPGIGEPTVQIDLPPALLGFVNEAAEGASPEAANALDGIEYVRVRVYENIGPNMAAVTKFVADTSATLEREGWHAAVRIRDEGESVRIYMKPTTRTGVAPGTLDGLTVMVTDEGSDEAVFINVSGAIQPEKLGKLAGAVGMNGVFNQVPGATPAPPPPGQPRQ